MNRMTAEARNEISFVEKVYDMLDAAEREGFQDIVRWEADGSSFKVYKTKDFETKLQPAYFNQTKLRSFQRKVSKPDVDYSVLFHVDNLIASVVHMAVDIVRIFQYSRRTF